MADPGARPSTGGTRHAGTAPFPLFEGVFLAPCRGAQVDYDCRMPTRRDLLSHAATVAALLAGAGLLPGTAHAAPYPAAAFEAKSLAELVKTLGVAAPVESKEVAVSAPEIAENGAVVPIGVSTSLPGVARLLLLVEKNPAILSAMFELSDSIEANFLIRVKMSQSSNVYAVAVMKDGRLLFARRDVKVTLGGCAA